VKVGGGTLTRDRANDFAPKGLSLRQSRPPRKEGEISSNAPQTPLVSEKTKLIAQAANAQRDLDAAKKAADIEIAGTPASVAPLASPFPSPFLSQTDCHSLCLRSCTI
jgi:hypothetical protein